MVCACEGLKWFAILTDIQGPCNLGVGLLTEPETPVPRCQPPMRCVVEGNLDHTCDVAVILFRILEYHCVELTYSLTTMLLSVRRKVKGT